MRTSFRADHLALVGAVLVISFCIVDEEPILDLSDFNLLHVWVLVGCALSTYFDLVMRARNGQFVLKDTTSMAAAFTFTWGLENYIRVLLLVFCMHSLLPLEIDLLEGVALYQAWGAWVTVELAPTIALLTILLGVALNLNLLLASGGVVVLHLTLLFICVGQLVALLLLL